MLHLCKPLISEELFWKRPNEVTNPIGNLLLHLCGNMRQYVISGLGNLPDTRIRDLEFAENDGLKSETVWHKFDDTLKIVIETIQRANESDLLGQKFVQGFHLSGLGLVLHAVEHLSYHTGQIALIVKIFENRDLGFYAGTDLNIKNE
jgi:uncharacterized damage-inducible protein DinB